MTAAIINRSVLEEFMSLLIHTGNIGWDNDPRGRDYWSGVHTNLIDILATRPDSILYPGPRSSMFRYMADLLNGSLDWEYTSQGTDYWQDVWTTLVDRANESVRIEPYCVQKYEEFLI